jgi:multimeric flavodoxin WrbA
MIKEIGGRGMSNTNEWNFSELNALFFNCTLTKSPAPSHTELLINASKNIMEKHGVKIETIRAIDHKIATGIYPDMREHGWDFDEWPDIYEKVRAADIVVLAGPIWLGDNSSVTKQVIERLYANSHILNEQGQYADYGKVGGCLITGNEDGVKHCAMNVLYSLQHLGYTIPPQADAGWIGEAGPGPSYGDKLDDGTRAGLDNDFVNRNTTFMTWNLLHMAKMLKSNGGIPTYGNQRSKWDAGSRFDFTNPEYR